MADEAPAAEAAPAEAPAEAPPAEAPVKREPEHLKTWKAAEKPAYEKMPPDTPRKPIDKDVEKTTELSKEQLQVLREAFKIFDSDKKGAISIDVVKIILELITGEEVDEDELDDVMEEFDEDESGEIEFAEFVKLASQFVEPEEDYDTMKERLRDLFVFYDKEQRGYIPVDEFKAILKELDPELPDDEAAQMVKEIDADESGTIEFDGEFGGKLRACRSKLIELNPFQNSLRLCWARTQTPDRDHRQRRREEKRPQHLQLRLRLHQRKKHQQNKEAFALQISTLYSCQ
jgi:calmodulin